MKNTELLTPTHWADYELIDCGAFEKLERFGDYVIARPEPQAIWSKSLSDAEWKQRVDAYFSRDKRNDERGEWLCRRGMPQQWLVGYCSESMQLRMRLGLTSFKHVGIFPEQAENWDYIYRQVCRIRTELQCANNPAASDSPVSVDPAVTENPTSVSSISGSAAISVSPTSGQEKDATERVRVLNLFAYTGGATLAACSAGAEVTHVDSVKPVVSWARENMEASGLDGVRWIVDDALKFVKREVKRGKTYHGIILDPPAYGRGADGEKWVLEENINEMLTLCGQLLEPGKGFLVLNLYSMGLSALLARTAVRQLVGESDEEQFGELYFNDSFGKALPLGVYYRCFIRS